MLTMFGKLLRKHQIDFGSSLKKMASCLGVSPGYLSMIVHGRRHIHSELLDNLSNWADSMGESLAGREIIDLRYAADCSQPGLRIKYSSVVGPEHRRLGSMFGRVFADLTDDQINKILQILLEDRIPTDRGQDACVM